MVQNIFIAIITDGFQSLKFKPINRTGADEDEKNKKNSPQLSGGGKILSSN